MSTTPRHTHPVHDRRQALLPARLILCDCEAGMRGILRVRPRQP